MNKILQSKLSIVFIAVSMCFVSCTPQSASTLIATTPKVTTKIKIGIMPYISNAVLQIAQDSGYFAEQNLDIEFVQIKSSSEVIPLLASGAIDVGTPALNAGMFNTIEKGAKFKVILPLTEAAEKDCSAIAFLARKSDIDVGKYADKSTWGNAKLVLSVNGLTSIPGYLLSKALSGSGLTVDQINLQNVDIPAQEEALRSGQVDIVYAVEPAVTRLTDKGDIAILDPAENYAPGMALSLIGVGEKVYSDPDVAKRFSIAYIKAARQYAKAGTDDDNMKSAVSLTQLSPNLVKQMCWSTISINGLLNTDSIQDYQKWLVERGLLDKVLEPDQYYDPSYTYAAIQILGKQ